MASLDMSKTVTASLPKDNEQLISQIVDFLAERNIEEVNRRSSTRYTFLEFNAESMRGSWKRLEADLEDDFDNLKTQYSEGSEDEEDYYSEEENLEIYI